MLFIRTKMFGIRIVYERSGDLRSHAHCSRTKLKNLRESEKNIRMIWHMVNSIRNLRKSSVFIPARVIDSSDSYKRWLEDFFC